MIAINISMPTSCNKCPCYYATEGAFENICQAKNCENWEEAMVTIDNIQVKKPDWCPLIDLKQEDKA